MRALVLAVAVGVVLGNGTNSPSNELSDPQAASSGSHLSPTATMHKLSALKGFEMEDAAIELKGGDDAVYFLLRMKGKDPGEIAKKAASELGGGHLNSHKHVEWVTGKVGGFRIQMMFGWGRNTRDSIESMKPVDTPTGIVKCLLSFRKS